MAVIVPSRPVPHGSRSPTLSDAGMILPHDPREDDRSISPLPYIERPPSPPELYPDSSPVHKLNLSPAPQGRRASHQRKTPPLSAQSSRSTLRNMADSDPARSAAARDTAIASSPTVNTALGPDPSDNWNLHGQRRLSTASSSVRSEDLDNWPGFDSRDHFDDSGVDLEEQQEKRDASSGDAVTGDDMGNEPWPQGQGSGSDEDDGPYSSAALSRRAEIILANAKKRLNVMEGNLRGARESLVVSPTFSGRNSALDLSHHINATRERDRRLYAGMGPIPPRIPAYRTSPLSTSGSPGHTRGLSETSVPLQFTPSYATRNTTNKRSSSAIGHSSNLWPAEGFGQGRFPIKESRSVEVLRDPRNTWNTTEKENGRSHSRSSRSPPGLETLPEDGDVHVIHRSASAASGLRDQMNDLKGRISSLKLKAQEDNMRRRSMQNLRAPSPFSSAETWYTDTNAYQVGSSSLASNAGLGIKTESPTRKALYEDEPNFPAPATNNTESAGPATRRYEVKEQGHISPGQTYARHFDEPNRTAYNNHNNFDEAEADETDDGDDADFVSVDGDDIDLANDSVYEDAVYEMPVTARHEDRIDAFDYEHFFLHSAMGTYGLNGRRDSMSSGSSTETTRPVTAMQNNDEFEDDDLSMPEKRISYHSRNPSADSVSTVASFATAAEQVSDDEEENEQMDQFSQQLVSSQYPMQSRPGTQNGISTLRSDSAINMRRGNGSSPSQTVISRGSSSPGELASGLQTSKIFSILTEGPRDEPHLALSEEETQLIYGLAASMQQMCANLTNNYGEAYERKEWRRRLDQARRILNGEDDYEDDQSF